MTTWCDYDHIFTSTHPTTNITDDLDQQHTHSFIKDEQQHQPAADSFMCDFDTTAEASLLIINPIQSSPYQNTLPLPHPLDQDHHHWSDESDRESDSTYSHHSSEANSSHTTTPFDQHSSHPQTPNSPLLTQAQSMPMHMMPTIPEQLTSTSSAGLCRPVPTKPVGLDEFNSAMNDIGMLQPTQFDCGLLNSTPTPTNTIVQTIDVLTSQCTNNTTTPSGGRATRGKRNRYATAAESLQTARAEIASHASHHSSSSLPSSPPSLESHSSMDITSTGSAHSSENECDDGFLLDGAHGGRSQQNDFEDEEDEYVDEDEIRPGKQASKRKRKNSSSIDLDSPCMKGLDKRARNKLSASMYRKRRKIYLDSLEGKVGELDQTIAKQHETIQKQAQENKVLKEQVAFLKKMMQSLKGGVTTTSDEEPQPTNIHHGGRRGVTIGGLLFIVLSCLLIFSPFTGTDMHDASLGHVAAPTASFSRAGRTLLSFDESTLDTTTHYYSSSSSYASPELHTVHHHHHVYTHNDFLKAAPSAPVTPEVFNSTVAYMHSLLGQLTNSMNQFMVTSGQATNQFQTGAVEVPTGLNW